MSNKLPLRILHILNSLNRGGIETTLINIYRKLNKKEIQFDFLIHTNQKCDYEDEIVNNGGKVFRVTPRSQSYIRNIRDLNDFFKNNEYKIIHQHVSSLSYITPSKIAKQHKVPVRIIHSRNTKQGGSKLHKYIHYWNRFNVKSFSTHYLACSDLAAEWLYGKKLARSSKCQIINNGISTEKFVYNEDIRSKIRNELLITEDEIVIGHVGRFHYQKNHKFLLDIFKSALITNKNFKLILVGDGALKKYIECRINEMKLQENVLLLGVKENINELLQAFDIFCMPSYYEGLPGSVIEAQGAGLPCLISDTITSQVKITDLVRFKSINDTANQWSEEINKLLNEHTRSDTQQELINKGFDMLTISNNLVNFYISALGDKSNSIVSKDA